ncbi:metacaspase 1, putative [Plasmodium gallinaceum]|uniref:Metacaspase 1, putative n=1 Tax=Plasmodium gallinaceum TaxID=5849 RepID=A0A1J1GRI9_PLAGA|nr:metacaspase 1, putative [Plasmodium gallinaceum]CRG93904.1 metacaspase 1, putative [Plasmodium gallinaceum]
MEKIYIKVFELSELNSNDYSTYYIKVYWKNKKYKSSKLRGLTYKFNEEFIIPLEKSEDDKEKLFIEVWVSGLVNRKVAYTFFTLQFIRKERIIKQKINLKDVLKMCSLDLSVFIIKNESDIIFYNIQERFPNKTNKEIKDSILKNYNEKDTIIDLQKGDFVNVDTSQKNRYMHFQRNMQYQNDIPLVDNIHELPNATYNMIPNTYNINPPLDVYNGYNYNNANNSNIFNPVTNKMNYPLNNVSNLNSVNNLDNNNRNTFLPNPVYYTGNSMPSPYSEKILYFSSGNKKKALLIGINYYGTKYELKGCVNDTLRMKNLLISKYNFYDSSMTMIRLIDNESNPNYRPTKKNILSALAWLTTDNKPGDIFFFLYSGHGSQQKDYTNIEEDGYNETILPCDFKSEGEIIDNDLHRYLIQPLNDGVKLISVVDCCSSGTCLDLAYKYKLKSKKWKEEKNPFHVVCDVSQFSGCKDGKYANEIDNKSNAPGGSLVTSMIHILNTNKNYITYEYLLQNINNYIKTYNNQKICFMSSQKFSLDRIFDFEHILKNKNEKLGLVLNSYIKIKEKKKKKF